MKRLFIKPIQDQFEKVNQRTKKLVGIIDKSDENHVIQSIMNLLHKINDNFYIITKRSEYYLYGYDSDNLGVKIIVDHNFSEMDAKISNIEMHMSPSTDNENDLIISIETDNPEHSDNVEAFNNFCLQKLFIYEE